MVAGHLQEKKGYFYIVLSYPDASGKRKTKWLTTGLPVKGNKKKAEKMLMEARREFEPECKPIKADVLFSDFMLHWLEIVKPTIAITTYSSYCNMVKRVIVPYFKERGIALSQLRPTDIQIFYMEQLKRVTANSVIHYHANIHKALKYAVKIDLLDSNPADKVERPKKNPFMGSFYDSDEVARLFEAAKGTVLEIPVFLGAFYGLRRSEVLGLKWSAIGFQSNTITIKHTVTSCNLDGKNVQVARDTTKTKSSLRTLPLVPAFREKLLEVMEHQQECRRLCGKCYNKEYLEYICVDEMGNLVSPHYLTATLLTDRRYKGVSMEAKVLYGLMLDRMGLSIRNSWLDSEGRVYIYFTLEDALAMLGCGKDKAVRLFKELDVSGGIGLIERRKQGQGKPTRIYVKNFTLPPDPEKCGPGPAPEEPPAQTSEKPKSGLPGASEVLTSEIPKSALLEGRSQDFGISAANKTDKNNTELSDTELSIHPPTPAPPPTRCQRGSRDRIEQMDAYRALIHENISYGELLQEHPYDADLIDGYVELMVEVCCTGRDTVRVNQEDIPTSVVRSRFLKLDREHILYVIEAMQRNTTQVVNIRAYTLSALYNAPVTIGQYYTAQVSHDMAQGWGVGT